MPDPWEAAVAEMRAKILDIERDLAGIKEKGDNSGEVVALKDHLKKLQTAYDELIGEKETAGKKRLPVPAGKDALVSLLDGE